MKIEEKRFRGVRCFFPFKLLTWAYLVASEDKTYTVISFTGFYAIKSDTQFM